MTIDESVETPIELDGDKDDEWRSIKFNYNGQVNPPLNRAYRLDGVALAFDSVDHFLIYRVAGDARHPRPSDIIVDASAVLLMLSTTNSAHSLCEILSFLNYYTAWDERPVCITSHVVRKMPFLYQLICKFVPEQKRIILDHRRIYRFRKLEVRRNNHFNIVANWNEIDFQKNGDVLTFDYAQQSLRFDDDPMILFRACRQVVEQGRLRYPTYDRLMLIKERSQDEMTTPGRAMTLMPEARTIAEQEGFKIQAINDFSTIEEYLTVLYSARILVTSYGGAACTNRFFVNPAASVILLANKAYEFEYTYVVKEGRDEYWHIRHSHLFPCKEQRILLDEPDCVTAERMRNILSHVGS